MDFAMFRKLSGEEKNAGALWERSGMCFPSQRKLTAEIHSQLIQKIWWQTAASCKWRAISNFTLHNSGTEDFLIWLQNYPQKESGGRGKIGFSQCYAHIPGCEKPWLSFWVLMTLPINKRTVSRLFKHCKLHMTYWFTNTVYILTKQSRKKYSYKEVWNF